MSITARQHTVIALLLCCALAAALHLGRSEMSYDELVGMKTQYEMYAPLPRILYSAIISENNFSILQLRFISIVFSGFGLLFSWLLARRVVSISLALAVPAIIAGASFWNMSARSATPDMMILTTILAGVWLAFQLLPSQQPKSLLMRGVFVLKLLFSAILIAITVPFYGRAASGNIFGAVSASDIFSALPFIACIPFVVWFVIATRKNVKIITKNRNAVIILAIAAVFAVQSLIIHGNIGTLCLPFAVIAGIRVAELAFVPEISPRVGWAAVSLPYSITIATVVASLFGADNGMWPIVASASLLWGAAVLIGTVVSRTVIRQWLARAVIAVGVVVPLLLMLRIAAVNLWNKPNNLVAPEHRFSTLPIH